MKNLRLPSNDIFLHIFRGLLLRTVCSFQIEIVSFCSFAVHFLIYAKLVQAYSESADQGVAREELLRGRAGQVEVVSNRSKTLVWSRV